MLDAVPSRIDLLNDILKGREVFSNVGAVALSFRDYALAAKHYAKVTELVQKEWGYFAALGYAYEGLKKVDESLAAFEKALAQNPPEKDQQEVLLTMTDVAEKARNFKVAKGYLDRYMKLPGLLIRARRTAP